jgi:tyrosyl-tRNA synthetase|tara:strand:- start:95 stop:295 length:201 start_codon:yes stop_codon:yes gene_type:complete
VEGALMLLPSLYEMKKSWEELEQEIMIRFGKNYSNYPASVEYFIKIMNYIEKRKEMKSLVKDETKG